MGCLVNSFFADEVMPSINHLEIDDEAFDLMLTKKISQCEEEYFFDRLEGELELPELTKFLDAFIELKKSEAEEMSGFNKVENFALLKNLKNFTFSYCSKESDLSFLSQLSQIEELELMNCYSLENLNGIENLKSLQYLTLRSCFTLKNLDALKSSSQLKTLHLNDTYSLNTEVVNDLSGALPNCRVLCPIKSPLF